MEALVWLGLAWLLDRTGRRENPTMTKYARGVDVSLHQEHIDWSKVKASGIEVAIVKATQYGFAKRDAAGHAILDANGHKIILPGAGVDPTFEDHQRGARAAGFKRVGYYHWMEPQFPAAPGGDGAAQADYFLARLGPLQPSEFVALDVENRNLTGTQAQLVAPQMVKFLDRCAARLGRDRVLVYTSYSFAALYKLGDDPRLTQYPLWCVWYRPNDPGPMLPKGWRGWVLWQYTDKADIPGIGQCDANAVAAGFLG